MIESVVHYINAGLMDKCKVSGLMLKGFDNKKGLVELLVCKNTLRASLILKMGALALPEQHKNHIGTVLKSAASYRSHMSGEALMWQGKLNPHSLRFFEIMEASACTHVFDSFRPGMREPPLQSMLTHSCMSELPYLCQALLFDIKYDRLLKSNLSNHRTTYAVLSNGELHDGLEVIEQAIVATDKYTIVATETVASSSVATASSSSFTPENN